MSRSPKHIALIAVAAVLTATLAGCSTTNPATKPTPQVVATAKAPDDLAATPREAKTSIAEDDARTQFLAIAGQSIVDAERFGLTETSHFNGPNSVTLVFDPVQPKYKAAYHNTEEPDKYVLVLNRDYFSANYAQRLANQNATRVQANLDGSYTLFPAGDPIGYTYDVKNGRITHVEGLDPKTGKEWATSLQYKVTEEGMALLSSAVNSLTQ